MADRQPNVELKAELLGVAREYEDLAKLAAESVARS
jgi:hypothetical protein